MLPRRVAIALFATLVATTVVSSGLPRWFHQVTAHAPAITIDTASDAAAVAIVPASCSHAGCHVPAPITTAGDAHGLDAEHPGDEAPARDAPVPGDSDHNCSICVELARHLETAPGLIGPAAVPPAPTVPAAVEAVVATAWTPQRPAPARAPPAVA